MNNPARPPAPEKRCDSQVVGLRSMFSYDSTYCMTYLLYDLLCDLLAVRLLGRIVDSGHTCCTTSGLKHVTLRPAQGSEFLQWKENASFEVVE